MQKNSNSFLFFIVKSIIQWRKRKQRERKMCAFVNDDNNLTASEWIKKIDPKLGRQEKMCKYFSQILVKSCIHFKIVLFGESCCDATFEGELNGKVACFHVVKQIVDVQLVGRIEFIWMHFVPNQRKRLKFNKTIS